MLTQRVHQCEFCSASFNPRPQVKKPRACERSSCQEKRQRSNELAWREKNFTRSDPQYHRLRKQARLQQLKRVAECIGRCIHTGATFLGQPGLPDAIRGILLEFLLGLGIRKVNKFWPAGFAQSESLVT